MSDFWRLGMESQTRRDERMRDRVAMTTIYAARLVDDFNNPNLQRLGTPYPGSIQTNIGPMRVTALADMKTAAAGTRSSWSAAHHYMDKTIQRRDELLAQHKPEHSTVSTGATDALSS